MLANSVKVTAGWLLTCSDTSAWGSSLEVPGQGSLHQDQPYQAWVKGQSDLRSQIYACTHHVKAERAVWWGLNSSGVSLMASTARLKAAWNKPAPRLMSNAPCLWHWCISSGLPSLDGMSSAGSLPLWGYLQDLSGLLDHLFLWSWCLFSIEFTWIWPHFKELGQSPQAIQCNFLRKQNKK